MARAFAFILFLSFPLSPSFYSSPIMNSSIPSLVHSFPLSPSFSPPILRYVFLSLDLPYNNMYIAVMFNLVPQTWVYTCMHGTCAGFSLDTCITRFKIIRRTEKGRKPPALSLCYKAASLCNMDVWLTRWYYFYILEFLSVKQAARTSILSERWPNLWSYMPSLKL